MNRNVVTAAMREMRAAINEAEQLSARPELSRRDESRINVLLAKIAALRAGAPTPDDFEARWFRALTGGAAPPVEERQDMEAGSQTITYTTGTEGGYLVPAEFQRSLILGLAQWDPLLDENVVTLIKSDSFALRPMVEPGVDLSTFSASKVAEAAQQNPASFTIAAKAQTNGWTYRASLAATFELEQDAYQSVMDFMRVIYPIAFARGVGVDLVTGDGTTGPQGVLTGAASSGITTAAQGVISAADIENIYFALNRIHRHAPKCAWLMADQTYELVRKATDDVHRPLLNVVGDRELLMGRPVYVCPSMPYANGSKGIVFGDLEHYVVRVSRMSLIRSLQQAGMVEYGAAAYLGRMRADAKVLDPGSSTSPSIVYATLHS